MLTVTTCCVDRKCQLEEKKSQVFVDSVPPGVQASVSCYSSLTHADTWVSLFLIFPIIRRDQRTHYAMIISEGYMMTIEELSSHGLRFLNLINKISR